MSMNMYIQATVTPKLAKKMLNDRINAIYENEEYFDNYFSSGKTKLIEKDKCVKIDSNGNLSGGAPILKAIVKTGVKATVLVSFKDPIVINTCYPEIVASYNKYISKKLADMLNGTSDDPFKMDVTPEIASLFILRNINNRPVQEADVMNLVRNMRSGNWKGANASELTCDSNGVFNNGQHRCLAAILSDTTMEKMHLAGCVESNSDMDNGKKRTLKQEYLRAFGRSPKRIDTTNLLYRMVTTDFYTPVNALAVELYDEFTPYFEKYPEIFHKKSREVKLNAPYFAAFLILLASGKFSSDQIIKIHKSLNENELVDPSIDRELRNLQSRIRERKGEYNIGASSAANQIRLVYAHLSNLIPILSGKQRWKFVEGKPGYDTTKKRIDDFFYSGIGKRVKEIVDNFYM